MVAAFGRVLKWTVGVGFISFLIGFVGPMILTPGANQGPLLGILITGPLGVVAGFAIGLAREVVPPGSRPALFRVVLGVPALTVAVYAMLALGRGEGVPTAIALLVLSAAALFHASTGWPRAWPEAADRLAIYRGAAGVAAVYLAHYGLTAMRDGDTSRGAAATLLFAVVAVYFALTGRIPRWIRR